MKTLRIFLVIMLVLVVVKAYALKPQSVPKDIQAEAANSVGIHQGFCDYQGRQELCMVAYDEAKDTFWLLLFTEEGVLYKVVTLQQDKETVKWVHSQVSI